MSLICGLFSSVTSHAGMELSDETSFVSRRWGTILLLFQTLSALSWTSLHQSSSARWEHVRHSGSPQSGARWEMKGQWRDIFLKSEICGDYIYTVGLPAFLFSVLKVLWKGLTDEGSSMSNTREEAQPWMRLQHQTSPGTNLQHNTLQPTSLRSVRVSTKLWSSVFWSPCQPLCPSVCSQMKTAETYVNSVSWWCKPDSASTPTTRKSAVPPVFRVLSVPRDTDQPMADSPCAQVVED